MKNIFIFLLSLLTTFQAGATGKETLGIEVNSGRSARCNTLVEMAITGNDINAGTPVALFETTNGTEKNIPCQITDDDQGKPRLYWILAGNTPANTTRTYRLETNGKKAHAPAIKVTDKNGTLTLGSKKHPILRYNYKTVYPPQGIDTAYRRSGFIHPAWSPSGNILTNIQPKDHYHHYGIWNPWTRVIYDGKTYDLWNLGDKQGTVVYDRTLGKVEGPVWAGFTVKHKHLIFKETGPYDIMDELWSLKAWETAENGDKRFMWDFVSTLTPSTALPVLLEAYRYAGFGYRATGEWTKENCIMYTSEGKQRPQIDGTDARWIYITGTCRNGKSGLLFMSYPENRNHPEPLRIWDQNANNGRGDAFINFAPTKNKDWKLEPQQTYKLKYRVMAYDGEITPEEAERTWNDFANPPTVTIK